MFREQVQEALLEKLDLEIKPPSQEETGEVTDNRTSNQAVVLTEENKTCEEATDIIITGKEDKEVALKLEIMLLKIFRKWELQTTLMEITRIILIY